MIEDEQSPKPHRSDPLVLETMSVVDIRLHIGALQAEIARAESVIARKEHARSQADSVFGQPQSGGD